MKPGKEPCYILVVCSWGMSMTESTKSELKDEGFILDAKDADTASEATSEETQDEEERLSYPIRWVRIISFVSTQFTFLIHPALKRS